MGRTTFQTDLFTFCIKVITTRYSKKEWIVIAIVGVLVSISYLVNDKDEVVRAAVFVISCKNMDVKKILKVVLGITLAGSVILFVLAASGTFGAMTMTANLEEDHFRELLRQGTALEWDILMPFNVWYI